MGGAQRQLVQLSIGFKARGHSISFLTYHNIPFFKSDLEKHEIEITCIEIRNYIKRLFVIRRFIRNGNYDAVLSFLEAASFMCEFAGFPDRKWKLVVGERNSDPKIKKSFKRKFYRWMHLFADYVVANSNANIKLVRIINPFLAESKCRVIYNMVDFDVWTDGPVYLRRDDDIFNLVVMARLSHQKNPYGLVKALMLLNSNELKKIRIHWYGLNSDNDHDDSVNKAMEIIKTNGLENILSFYPASKNTPFIVRSADAVGLFSLYEGFPNSICEAMALAKTVICSAISDMPDLLSHESKLLFNPYDPLSIKHALSYLINLNDDQLIRIGKRNAEVAKRNFNKENIISKYLGLLS